MRGGNEVSKLLKIIIRSCILVCVKTDVREIKVKKLEYTNFKYIEINLALVLRTQSGEARWKSEKLVGYCNNSGIRRQ